VRLVHQANALCIVALSVAGIFSGYKYIEPKDL
jgi:Ni,Fe-hydrogenase I cytochrome b subunit